MNFDLYRYTTKGIYFLMLQDTVWNWWTDGNTGQKLVVFYMIMAENWVFITQLEILEPVPGTLFGLQNTS